MSKTLKILFYTTVGSLSLGQLANITRIFSILEPNIYLFDFIMLIFIVVGIFALLKEKKALEIPQYLIGFFIFSGVALVSLIPVIDRFNILALYTGFAYFLRWFVYLTGALITFNLVNAKLLNLNDILLAFIYSALFISVAGFVQLIIFPDFSKLDPILGWDPHKNRLLSTFFDPNFTGGYLVIILTLLIFKKERFLEFLNKKTLNRYFIVLLLALFFTYSRSAWGMFGIVVLFYALKRTIWLILTALVLAFSAYYAIPRIQTRVAGLTDPADSASFRFISWKDTIDIFNENKFLGVGFNAMKAAKIETGQLPANISGDHSASGSDSSFLLVLATTGIIGFIIFIVSYFLPLIDPDFYKLAIILGLFLQAQFINALFFPQIMFLWLILFSLFYIL